MREKIASDHFKTLESLAMIIYRILSSIERHQNYERLFSEDQGVQSAIGDLYADLIDFCGRVVRFHSKRFRSVFISFEHEFGLVAELVAFHSSQVDLAANAAHMYGVFVETLSGRHADDLTVQNAEQECARRHKNNASRCVCVAFKKQQYLYLRP